MHWRETTEEGDPRTRHGEWTCEQPWLEYDTNGKAACYTIRRCIYAGKWEPRWWHGSMEYRVGQQWAYKTFKEAETECRKHLLTIYIALKELKLENDDWSDETHKWIDEQYE